VRARDVRRLAILFSVALALRIAFRIDHDEDLDALRFRLGVERFDPAALRPHAPFYPVFVAAAKLVAAAGASPRGALAIVSAAGGAALVVLTALLAYEVAGRRAAFVAGALAVASPCLWLASEKLLSDATGAAVFTLGLVLVARARRLPAQAGALRTAAMVVLGVALGVRLSYFPIAIACLVVVARAEGGGRAWAARARDLAAGAALWLAPLVAAAGPRALVAASLAQGEGHFSRWGGSVITVPSPSMRILGTAWGLWANVLGGAWSDAPPVRWIGAPILVTLIALAAPRLRAAAVRQPEIALAAAAYAVWAFFGQNIAYKPRHWLPLAPMCVVALAVGEGRIARRRPAAGPVLAGILGATWLADGAALAAAHRAPSPAAAAVAWLADEASGRVVVTADLGPMIAAAAPGRRFVGVAEGAAMIAAGVPGVLATSEALPALRREGTTVRVVFSAPRSRYVDALWNELAVVEITAPPPRPP
jgi:hypothetical protein